MPAGAFVQDAAARVDVPLSKIFLKISSQKSCIAHGLLDLFSRPGVPMAMYSFSPFWKDALQLAVLISTASPELTFVVPVFIWIVVTLRRGDLERWCGGVDSPIHNGNGGSQASARGKKLGNS